MRVLVTGGAGFIGSHVVEELVAVGAEVSVLDDMSTGDVGNLRAAFGSGLDEADVHECDIRDPRSVAVIRARRPDVVVHLAARTSVSASLSDPAGDASVNVTGTVNVIHAAAVAGARKVVLAASSAIYGHVPETDLPVSEKRPWNPANPYGLSKVTGLRYLELAARIHGINYVALVLGNVYGPRQRKPSVVPTFLDGLRKGSPVRLHGTGRQTRDFVYVADAAKATVAACARGNELVVNIGSGTETRIRAIYDRVAFAWGATTEPAVSRVAPPVLAPVQPGDLLRMRLDIRRAASVLSWTPQVGLADGIAHTVAAAASSRWHLGGDSPPFARPTVPERATA